jgi:hypothetical protein
MKYVVVEKNQVIDVLLKDEDFIKAKIIIPSHTCLAVSDDIDVAKGFVYYDGKFTGPEIVPASEVALVIPRMSFWLKIKALFLRALSQFPWI